MTMPKIKPTVDACIDWIEVTSLTPCQSETDLRRRAAKATNTDPSDWRPDKAFNRYSLCLRHESLAQALCGRADMGVHIIASGQALTAFREHGYQPVDLLSDIGHNGYHATRIDLAIDVVNSRIDGMSTLRDFQEGRGITRANKPNMLISPNDGWTIYIGAAQSDQHLRIYNKEAEIDNKARIPDGIEDWIRIELVSMRQKSRAAAALIGEHGVAVAARSLIKNYADNPSDPKWARVMSGEITEVGKSIRKITDTKAWLLKVAARTLAREFIADPTIYDSFIDSVGTWHTFLLRQSRSGKHVDNVPDSDLQ